VHRGPGARGGLGRIACVWLDAFISFWRGIGCAERANREGFVKELRAMLRNHARMPSITPFFLPHRPVLIAAAAWRLGQTLAQQGAALPQVMSQIAQGLAVDNGIGAPTRWLAAGMDTVLSRGLDGMALLDQCAAPVVATAICGLLLLAERASQSASLQAVVVGALTRPGSTS
jgi:hypothetical protein